MNTHRMLKFFGVAWLVVGFGHRSANADFTPIRFEARQVATAPVIDGNLTDDVWGQAELMDEFYAFQSGGDPPAAATTARILWDETYLYVGFEMADADIRSSCDLRGACGRDANLFQGDVIELFVKESTSSARYHEFEWSPLGEEFDARFDRVRFGSPGTGWESGMSSAVQVQGTADDPSDTDTGWTIEARIPLADFELSTVDVGTEWTFTVARYDFFNVPPNPQDELMMLTLGDPDAPLAGATSGFHTYEIYDILEFTVIPEPSTAMLAVVSVGLGMGGGLRRRGRA